MYIKTVCLTFVQTNTHTHSLNLLSLVSHIDTNTNAYERFFQVPTAWFWIPKPPFYFSALHVNKSQIHSHNTTKNQRVSVFEHSSSNACWQDKYASVMPAILWEWRRQLYSVFVCFYVTASTCQCIGGKIVPPCVHTTQLR